MLMKMKFDSMKKRKMLMVGSDGPNVSKTVFNMLNERIKLERKLDNNDKGLIDIGTCNLHIVHNGFLKGLQHFGLDVHELVYKVYYFFHDRPAQREDFQDIQEELHVPQHQLTKHSLTRWLSLQNSAERLAEQWPCLRKYFLEFLCKSYPAVTNTKLYKEIVSLLRKKGMLAEIYFVICSAATFESFSALFQKQELLIHILYEELRNLITVLIGRTCKPDILKNIDKHFNDPFSHTNLMPIKEFMKTLPNKVKEAIKQGKMSEKEQTEFSQNAQQHLVKAGKHLLSKTPLIGKSLNVCKCLQTARITNSSSRNIKKIAQLFPIKDVDDRCLADEWHLLQAHLRQKDFNHTGRLEVFWADILYQKTGAGNLQYPNLTRIVQAALCLSHGQADIERGFSISSKVLTNERASMSERMLNARLNVKSGRRLFSNKIECVPITVDLLKSARMAHQMHKEYIAEQPRLKKQKLLEKEASENEKNELAEKEKKWEESKKKIVDLEEKLKISKQLQKEESTVLDKILHETNDRLKNALRNNNHEEIQIAQAMLETVTNLRSKEQESVMKTAGLESSINKRKSSLITSFVSKKPKKGV